MRFLFLFYFFVFIIHGQNDQDLAESYFSKGEFEKALYYYDKLNVSQPENSKYVFRIVKIHQELEQYNFAQQIIENKFKKTNNPLYLVELGYNFQLKNQLELAQENYDLAISLVKSNPAYSYSVAIKFEEHSLINYAISVLKFAIKNNDYRNYEFKLAELYAQNHDVENMFLSYLNFCEANESFRDRVLLILSEYIVEDSNSNYNLILKKILLKKLQVSPSIFWNQMMSWLYNQQKDFKKSFIQQKSIYKREQKTLQPIIYIGLLAKKNKDYDTAESAFNFILEISQQSKVILEAKIQLLNLDILLESRNFKEIQNDFKFLIDQYGSSDETLMLQLVYFDFLVYNMNDKDKAISLIEENLTRNFSNSSKAKMKIKLADIYLTQEKFNLALIYYTQVYNQIKTGDLAQEARFKVAKTSFYKGDFDWAESQLNILKSSTSKLIANDALELKLLINDYKLKDSLNLPLKLYAKADFYNFQNKNTEAYQILNELILNYPEDAIVNQALIFQAKILESKEKYNEALQNYELIINGNSSSILIDDAYFAAAELCRTKLNFFNKALKYYEKIIFQFQDSIHLVDSNKYYRSLRNSDN